MLLTRQRLELYQREACDAHLTEDQVRRLSRRVLQNGRRVNVDNVVFRQRRILSGIATQGHMKEEPSRQAFAQAI